MWYNLRFPIYIDFVTHDFLFEKTLVFDDWLARGCVHCWPQGGADRSGWVEEPSELSKCLDELEEAVSASGDFKMPVEGPSQRDQRCSFRDYTFPGSLSPEGTI